MQSIQFSKDIVKAHIANTEFPFLISFPRTGSHWLRMIMELYFKKPSLVRAFYYKNATDFTCYHHHDEELQIQRENVIYLYRNPVDTVYSQMKYYKEDINDIKKIEYWTNIYGRHLQKWLIEESFTKKKIVLTYEGMKQNIESEFKKVCDYFSCDFNIARLTQAVNMVTKEEVKNKTTHDKQVINNSKDYKLQKELFSNKKEFFINNEIKVLNSELRNFL